MRSGRNYLVLLLIMIFAVPVLVFGDSSGGIIELQIGSKTATVDGVEVELDTEPIIHNGRTMVPIRFIADAFGAVTSWDGETKTVTIEPNEPKLLDSEAVTQELIEAIGEAKISLRLLVRNEVDESIAESIKSLVSRGNKARLILSSSAENRSLFKENTNPNLQIKWACEQELPESEYVIINDSTIFVGNSSIFGSPENQVDPNIIKYSSSNLAKQYTAKFDTLWASVEGDCIPGFPEPTKLVWRADWEMMHGYTHVYSMSLTTNDVIVVVLPAGFGKNIRAEYYDTNSGKLLGELETLNKYYYAVIYEDFIIYGHENEDKTITINKFNPRTGQIAWTYDVGEPIKQIYNEATDSFNAIHVWGDEYLLLGKVDGSDLINIESGELTRTIETGDSFPFAVTSDKLLTLFVQENSTGLTVYDINGEVLWANKLGGIIYTDRFERKTVVPLNNNEDYMFLHTYTKDGEGDHLIDLNTGKDVWYDGPTNLRPNSLMTDDYLFVSNVGVNRRWEYGHFCLDIKTMQDVTSARSYEGSGGHLGLIIGYKDGQVLLGSGGILISRSVQNGAIDLANHVWHKLIGTIIPQGGGVLYDEKNHCYYMIEEGYFYRDAPGLLKYTCDK
ncbi:MAG TPA: stalk domain-containing protein [Caldisericia bacterium]|nr:stalk domain-containing protein [Caldisericia bacterium]HPF49768.1 stalk domain-containing protein [Caldisericia bacterium]HPI84329.1 stalk domain-containing protein [Caldisericia bacterium]HPQ93756.1 stalk domain-containing protein [Caldisericia bacterium]HRV74820.1 stalk domain-containing protein [Caldisericia bacterium]